MLKASDKGHRLTPEESRATDILDEQERAAGGRRKRRHKPDLDVERIVEWAAEHHARTGKWPTNHSGAVHAEPLETWCGLGLAINKGLRGLPGGTTLSRLLAERAGRHHPHNTPDLTEERIVAWAHAYRERAGRWPTALSGAIADSAPGDTWGAVSRALSGGDRGLPGGTTLARLLAERAGKRSHLGLPRLSEEQILAWADAYRAHTGAWPAARHVAIADTDPLEVWANVNHALSQGMRGLPGGTSLARLLAERRGAFRPEDRRPVRPPEDRNRSDQSPAGTTPLDNDRILAWADAHHAATGQWPVQKSGPVEPGSSVTWQQVDGALRLGRRGLPGGSSLAQLLGQERGRPNIQGRPPLTEAQILGWADAHRARAGVWPTTRSGPIPESECGETWETVGVALYVGLRGLPQPAAGAPRESLPRLLQRERGVANPKGRPPLTEAQILGWADAHRARTGQWPWLKSGRIVDAPDETWMAVEAALSLGSRGLPGGSSLAQLLRRERGGSMRPKPPPLSEEAILRWADAHRQRTGAWPTQKSGVVVDAGAPAEAPHEGETWAAIGSALKKGTRGLPGGTSLAALLRRERGGSYRTERRRRAGGSV
jgi:hypothetical protein